jgi:hypothetical protein
MDASGILNGQINRRVRTLNLRVVPFADVIETTAPAAAVI